MRLKEYKTDIYSDIINENLNIINFYLVPYCGDYSVFIYTLGQTGE